MSEAEEGLEGGGVSRSLTGLARERERRRRAPLDGVRLDVHAVEREGVLVSGAIVPLRPLGRRGERPRRREGADQEKNLGEKHSLSCRTWVVRWASRLSLASLGLFQRSQSLWPPDEEGKEKMGLEMLPIFPLGEACLKIG